MGKRDKEIESLLVGYRKSKEIGDSEAASQWANQIGNFYKDRSEYVEALKWFQIDYDIVSGRKKTGEVFGTRELMTTCQCLGETYRRLNNYEQALQYQTKHYELALEEDDLVEQQRASTQLGGTYADLYEEKNNLADFVKARDYYQAALRLSKDLCKSSASRDSFAKELVDSYNNIGMLKMLTENWQQAKKYFIKALQICDDEELGENAPSRSRVHHNLGRLYLDQSSEEEALKMAKEHMQLDIKICKVIQHHEGEAKGYINLGRLYLKQQLHDDAMQCFQSALRIARNLADEDELVKDIKVNIEAVNEARRTKSELLKRQQELKKLQREGRHKNHLLDEYSSLLDIQKQAEEALEDHSQALQFAKALKRVAERLCDSEKIGDAYGALGLAYSGLRKYDKAKKWFSKAFDRFKRIKNLEGQAVAKINYGNALDADGDDNGAFEAYDEAYRMAHSKQLLDQQKAALENIHYIYTRREDVLLTNQVNNKLEALKRQSADAEMHCSDSDDKASCMPIDLDLDEDARSSRQEVSGIKKRQRVVILDDDDEENLAEVRRSSDSNNTDPIQSWHAEKSGDNKKPRPESASESYKSARGVQIHTERTTPQRMCNLARCSNECSRSSNSTLQGDSGYVVPVDISGFVVKLNLNRSEPPTASSLLDSLMQLYKTAKPEGPHPVLKGLKIIDKEITPMSDVCDELLNAKAGEITAIVAGWREVPLMERYKLQCKKCNCEPNGVLLSKMEMAKEGEIDGSECDLDNSTAWPLFLALGSNDILSSINLSHNRLESSTINAFQDILSETKNKDMGLALDYHDNKLGASSLLKISTCQTTLSRLEVLTLSKNDLTDRVAHHLALVLQQAPRLQTLELEECKLTTPTFERLRDALQPHSQLRELSIGRNGPIAGHALRSLFEKLSTLPSFANLDITDVQANCTGVEGLVHLIMTSSTLSVLVLKQNCLRTESWKLLRNAFAAKSSQLTKIDLTDCKIPRDMVFLLCTALLKSPALSNLSLAGNCLDSLATTVVTQELAFGGCQLKTLNLSNCRIEVCKIVASLQANYMLEELKLTGNACSTAHLLAEKLPLAGFLNTLDLSDNGFDDATVEELYKAWCQGRRAPSKHVQGGGVVHFSVEGSRCCNARPCCRF